MSGFEGLAAATKGLRSKAPVIVPDPEPIASATRPAKAQLSKSLDIETYEKKGLFLHKEDLRDAFRIYEKANPRGRGEKRCDLSEMVNSLLREYVTKRSGA